MSQPWLDRFWCMTPRFVRGNDFPYPHTWPTPYRTPRNDPVLDWIDCRVSPTWCVCHASYA